MGSKNRAVCHGCKAEIIIKDGGGWRFHQLRCVRCGKATRVAFSEIADIHMRFLKGSSQPYAVAYVAEHRAARADTALEPMSHDEYHDAVEGFRKCDCGGRLSFDAPPRCPRCGSSEIEIGECIGCYD